MKRLLRWLASLLHLRRRVRFVAWVLPNRYWYRAALAMSRLQGVLNGALGGNRVLTEAVMLGADSRVGTVYCWIHEPLVEFPMRPFIERGNSKAIVVAHRGRIVDGDRYMVFGLKGRLMAIPADRYALGRAKRLLAEGTSVVCLADEYLGGPLLPFVLQLAGRVGARVVFQWAKRRPDGTIEVTIVNAPRPYCETPETIRENLAFLR